MVSRSFLSFPYRFSLFPLSLSLITTAALLCSLLCLPIASIHLFAHPPSRFPACLTSPSSSVGTETVEIFTNSAEKRGIRILSYNTFPPNTRRTGSGDSNPNLDVLRSSLLTIKNTGAKIILLAAVGDGVSPCLSLSLSLELSLATCACRALVFLYLPFRAQWFPLFCFLRRLLPFLRSFCFPFGIRSHPPHHWCVCMCMCVCVCVCVLFCFFCFFFDSWLVTLKLHLRKQSTSESLVLASCGWAQTPSCKRVSSSWKMAHSTGICLSHVRARQTRLERRVCVCSVLFCCVCVFSSSSSSSFSTSFTLSVTFLL
jgi:hypothetical protein